MSRPVAIVTDSTAYLPVELVREHDVRIVPLKIVIGDTTYDEGAGIGPEAVAQALRHHVPVSTSRPSPTAFLATYEAAAASGAESVVSVHLSAEMSGTLDSAGLAARSSPVPVHLVDSRSLAMGLGFAVLAAARAVASGETCEEAASAARLRAAATSGLFYVDTLEHLRRGGRIGAAQALLGSALAIKPLLQLDNGRIGPLEKVRTSSRAIARLEEIAAERAGEGAVEIAVHHLGSVDKATELAERLRRRIPAIEDLYVSEVGAVVGAHVGPGLLGVVVAPR